MEPLLALAVPMWIERLKTKRFEDFQLRREKILESVCYKGDLLLYGSKKKGETAELFNDLAEGLAWLALIAKGGVTFGEQHWDAEFETLPNLSDADQRASEPEKMQAVCKASREEASMETHACAAGGGSKTRGDADAT
jgi:hypothetical protein